MPPSRSDKFDEYKHLRHDPEFNQFLDEILDHKLAKCQMRSEPEDVDYYRNRHSIDHDDGLNHVDRNHGHDN